MDYQTVDYCHLPGDWGTGGLGDWGDFGSGNRWGTPEWGTGGLTLRGLGHQGTSLSDAELGHIKTERYKGDKIERWVGVGWKVL